MSPSIVGPPGNRVVVFIAGNNVIFVNAATGAKINSVQIAAGSYSAPSIVGGKVLAQSSSGLSILKLG